MIEMQSPLGSDEETVCVGFKWARLRVGARKMDGKVVAALSIWERGVMQVEFVEFCDPSRPGPVVDIVWQKLKKAFEIEELNAWHQDELRHG